MDIAGIGEKPIMRSGHVPESSDWYNSSYILVWGSNLPQTRTPDAHFYVEARYNGTKVVSISPDYAEFVKFADHWLNIRFYSGCHVSLM